MALFDTHREQLLVFTRGNVCPSQNTASAALTRQTGFIAERRKKFRAVRDDFCISDL